MTATETFQLILYGVEQTEALGTAIGSACVGGEKIALIGELGAGKTSFARGVAIGLGLDPTNVSSPTFTILHEHLDARSGLRFTHADAYRVGDLEELEALGWQEFLEDDRTVLAVEWPNKVAGALASPELTVTFAYGETEESRHVTLAVAEAGAHLYPPSDTRCPSCKKETNRKSSTFPFCSERCRMADLGKWFTGHYVISREIEEDDLFDENLG